MLEKVFLQRVFSILPPLPRQCSILLIVIKWLKAIRSWLFTYNALRAFKIVCSDNLARSWFEKRKLIIWSRLCNPFLNFCFLIWRDIRTWKLSSDTWVTWDNIRLVFPRYRGNYFHRFRFILSLISLFLIRSRLMLN